jgi:hypothetical protein
MTTANHEHVPGAKLHDDHVCGLYRCLLCGLPIVKLRSVWVLLGL